MPTGTPSEILGKLKNKAGKKPRDRPFANNIVREVKDLFKGSSSDRQSLKDIVELGSGMLDRNCSYRYIKEVVEKSTAVNTDQKTVLMLGYLLADRTALKKLMREVGIQPPESVLTVMNAMEGGARTAHRLGSGGGGEGPGKEVI